MMQPAFSESSSLVTEGIRVSVRSLYLTDESSPVQNHYVFAYQVQIRNETGEEVQLLSRKWDITDGFGFHRQVEGEGVVGSQPVIAPGKHHEYVSGCDFKTPVGRMSGHFNMISTSTGKPFSVQIPPFVMVSPALLN